MRAKWSEDTKECNADLATNDFLARRPEETVIFDREGAAQALKKRMGKSYAAHQVRVHGRSHQGRIILMKGARKRSDV